MQRKGKSETVTLTGKKWCAIIRNRKVDRLTMTVRLNGVEIYYFCCFKAFSFCLKTI
jgi:hypothetical protein